MFAQMRMEIGKTLLALAKQYKIENVSEILMCGSGAALYNLRQALSKSLQTSISLPQPKDSYSSEDLQTHAIAIGLAITALNGWGDQINFRKADFVYPYPWRRYKFHFLVYGLLCLVLAFMIYLFGAAWTQYQESKLKERYSSFLESIGKPYSSFEKEFISKTESVPEGQEVEVKPLSALSQKELENRIDYLEKDTQAIPDVFQLVPNIPRASDVLAWLSNHPNVIGTGEKETPLLTIESFSYTLVKKPDMKKKQEKYQAKVEIEFSTSVPKYAREFHDALIAPNDMVDPKNEVKWSSARDRYRTSFFLKNKPLIER